MSDWPNEASLGEVRLFIADHMEGGTTCPACTQHVKVYRRPMTATTARAIIAMHRNHGREFVHLPTLVRDHLPDVAHQGGYATLAQHWGLIQEERIHRPDGGRAGWWRLTSDGERFALGEFRVPKYALLYSGECGGVTGEMVGIREALGTKFDYERLMLA